MVIGVLKELQEKERRVAVTPKSIKQFRKLGFEVWVETGAGHSA